MRCVVVGAGIIGLSIAWELTRRGAEVVVLDPAPASGATRAAAGMLAAVSEFHYQELDLLNLSVPAARRWPGWAAELSDASGVEPGFAARGTIAVAADSADRETLADLRRAQSAAGMDVEELTVRGARTAEPMLSPRLAGAFVAQSDGQTDPRRTAAALREALARSPGARFLSGTALRCVAGANPAVEYDGGRLACDEIVLAGGLGLRGAGRGAAPGAEANGTWAGPLLEGLPTTLRLPVRPVYGDVLRLGTPRGGPRLAGTTIRGLVGGHGVYVVPRDSGEVVVGATEREDGRAAVSAGGVQRLLRDALRLVPVLGEFDLVESIARARPGTPDNLPLLGRAAPGLVVATGFHRHGVLLSPQAAAVVAELLGGQRAEDPPGGSGVVPSGPGPTRPAAFDPAPFDPAPFDPWRFS